MGSPMWLKRIRRSLRARLVLAAGGSILAAVVLFGGAAVWIVRHELRSSLDSALRERAFQVSELAVSAPAVLTAPGALESPVSGRQIAVEVLDSSGRIVARSLALVRDHHLRLIAMSNASRITRKLSRPAVIRNVLPYS